MKTNENQIVVYQPNGVMKIDVRFDGETVWLLQPQIAELFSCSLENVRLHLKNIYACGELEKAATSKESLEVRKEGNREVKRKFLYYNLDAIISIGYRVNSIVGVRFRQWATDNQGTDVCWSGACCTIYRNRSAFGTDRRSRVVSMRTKGEDK